MSIAPEAQEARAELEAHHEDPFLEKVEEAVRDKDAISTAALLDLLREQATTGTARRLAAVMRSLHFIPIKSRRLCRAAEPEIPSLAAGPVPSAK